MTTNEGKAITVASSDVGMLAIPSKADAVAYVQRASDLATVLAEIIEKRKLFKEIRGKKHIEVEAWQVLATLVGCSIHTYEKSSDERGVLAVAELRRDSDGAMVSMATNRCGGPDDDPWDKRSLQACSSMAQTRAAGKVGRNKLSWIVVLAGYAPTPAEEMDGVERERPAQQTQEAPRGVPCVTCGAETFAFKDGKMRGHKTGQKDAQGKDIWHRQPVAAEKPAEAPAPRPEAKTPPVETTARPAETLDFPPEPKTAAPATGVTPHNRDAVFATPYDLMQAAQQELGMDGRAVAIVLGAGKPKLTPADKAAWTTLWDHWVASRAPAPKGGAA